MICFDVAVVAPPTWHNWFDANLLVINRFRVPLVLVFPFCLSLFLSWPPFLSLSPSLSLSAYAYFCMHTYVPQSENHCRYKQPCQITIVQTAGSDRLITSVDVEADMAK